jgi:thiosulfate/3-mercaptopyruvate sulfurtransferase
MTQKMRSFGPVAAVLAAVWLCGAALPVRAQPARPQISLATAPRIQPAELAALLKAPASQRPLILHVGFEVLYRGAHIPGAIFVGPASRPEGLKLLRQRLARIPRTREIVLYCGCCPWEKCPNIGPAYAELIRAGFRRVRVLYLPNDFARDWVQQGLPVEQGPPR